MNDYYPEHGEKEMCKMKHFNLGTVWGKVKEFNIRHTKKNHLPYAEMKIYCPSDQHGDVMVYARLWGKVEDFKKVHHLNPTAVYKFKGNFSQFKDRGRTFSGFNLFSFEETEEERLRAVFILVGECEGKRVEDNGEGVVLIHVKTGKDGEYKENDQIFEIFVSDSSNIADIHTGEMIECKGVLEDKDFYFGSSNNFKPYAQKISVHHPEP